MPSLTDFARRVVASRPMSRVYSGTLIRRAAALQLFSQTDSLEGCLTEPMVNGFLANLDGSPYTKKSYRGDLLLLWRAAADEGFVPYPMPRRIRRERLPDLVVECFTEDEARQIVTTCRTLRGGLPNGVGKRLYWEAIVRAAWDTALRRGDLWGLRRDCIRGDGTAIVVQNKTGKLASVRFRPSTIAALDAIGGTAPLGWPLNSCSFGEAFRKIVRASGVQKGTFRWFRRASGSYVEALQPGSGHKQCGHSTTAVFNKHYDAKLAGTNWPQPPEL